MHPPTLDIEKILVLDVKKDVTEEAAICDSHQPTILPTINRLGEEVSSTFVNMEDDGRKYSKSIY